MELKGRKVIVTGGAVRIGAAICRAFAEAGAEVLIHFSRSAPQAAKLLEEIGGGRRGHSVFRCDFTRPAELRRMARSCLPADILVNNASVFRPAAALDEDPEKFDQQMRINFGAPLFLAREFCRTGGRLVINILDERVQKLLPSEGSYELSKKSLLWATEVLAVQAAPRTRVNAVAPGATLPPIGMAGSTMQRHRKKIPLRRTPEPGEIADACIFLARNDIINGQTLFIDGGQHLVWTA